MTDVRRGEGMPSTGMYSISCLQVVASLQAERHFTAEHFLQAPPDPAHAYHIRITHAMKRKRHRFLKKKEKNTHTHLCKNRGSRQNLELPKMRVTRLYKYTAAITITGDHSK